MPPHILIIDDEIGMRHILSAILDKKGFNTDTAPDIPTALEKIRSTPPDIICCDLMMPDISGLDFLEQHRQTSLMKDIPVIVITASGEQRMIDRALELGADAHVAKPLNTNHLVNLINNLLTNGPNN